MFLLFLFLLFPSLSSIHHRDTQIHRLIYRNREDEANWTRFSLLSLENSEGLFSFSSLLSHAFPCPNSSHEEWPDSSATLLFPCLHGDVLDTDSLLHFKMSHPHVVIPTKCSVVKGLHMDFTAIQIPLNETLELDGDHSLRIFSNSNTRSSSLLDRPIIQFSYERRDEDCEVLCENSNYSIYSTPLCLGEIISENEIEVCDMTDSCKWKSSPAGLTNIATIPFLDNEKYMTMNGTNERVTFSSPYIAHTSVKCSFVVDALLQEGSSMDLSYSSIDGKHEKTVHLTESHTPFKLKPFSIPIGHSFSPLRIDIICHKGSFCKIDNLRMKNCEDDSSSMEVCPSSSSFLCSSSFQSLCLPLHRICDLATDCTTGEDESNCEDLPSHALCNFSHSSNLSFCPHWISSGPLDGISFGEANGRNGSSMKVVMGEEMREGEKTAFTSPSLPPSSHALRDPLSSLFRSCTLRFSYCASVRWSWTDFRWMINGHKPIWDLMGEKKNDSTGRESLSGKCEWKREVIEIPIMSTSYSLSFEIFSTKNEPSVSHFELADLSIAESCFLDDSSISPLSVYNLWPCNGTGPLPPSIEQCQSFYAETDETEQLVMERSGWITWIAPRTNEYRVELCGASGGSMGGREGGKGGCIVAIISLGYNEEVEVMIGQEGEEKDQSLHYSGTAGGGATLMKKNERDLPTIILVAGGGGGINRETHDSKSANGGRLSNNLSEEDIRSAFKAWEEGDGFSHAFGPHFTIRCDGKECDAVNKEANKGGRCNSSVEYVLGGYGGGGPGCGDSPGPGGGYIGGKRNSNETGGTSFIFYEEDLFEVFEGVHSGSGFIRIFPCTLECPFNQSCIFQSVHRGELSHMKCECIKGADCNGVSSDGWKFFFFTAAFLLLLVFALLIFSVTGGRRRLRERERFNDQMEEIEMVNQEFHEMDHFECLHKLTRIQIPHILRGDILMKRLLGKGAFGEVHLAELIEEGERREVAVKTLTLKLEWDVQLDFTFETLTLHKLDHVNIVRALGINMEIDPYYLIIEYMKGGDLRTFLRLFRSGDIEVELTMKDFFSFALDIATGCEYLEENHVIHRDLAARNCLLTKREEGRIVKLADFGMARDIYSIDYYRKNGRAKMPVKWLPPESYLDGKFDGASDRWSFGVLLWEIFSLGHMPYPGMSNYQVMENVRRGKRLLPPCGTPSPIHHLMLSTWRFDPSSRPSFKEILSQIRSIASSQSEYARRAPPGIIKCGMMQTEEGQNEEYTRISCPRKRREDSNEIEEISPSPSPPYIQFVTDLSSLCVSSQRYPNPDHFVDKRFVFPLRKWMKRVD
ncbi:hypothetical protein PMAYCL1PPCAC_29443 [Pristionchus mayeri]|uniref:Tyrosine-protein kinase receptor n=1 Tax=Pristionchus mayeri TaxID=1317129 RepID=A0AAN5IAW2_9BILA|nr:hypothetical protein PMAYCL1PPCAC_29443 [Pristionchus mayeri]